MWIRICSSRFVLNLFTTNWTFMWLVFIVNSHMDLHVTLSHKQNIHMACHHCEFSYICDSWSDFNRNVLPQTEHLYGSSSLWMLIWFMSPLVTNRISIWLIFIVNSHMDVYVSMSSPLATNRTSIWLVFIVNSHMDLNVTFNHKQNFYVLCLHF